MRILLVHNFHAVQGGAEVFVKEVQRVLEAQGHEAALFYPQDEGTEGLPYAEYFPKPVNYKGGSLIKTALNFGKIIYSKASKQGIQEVIARFKPDIVHAFATYVRLTPAVLDGCREMGVPVVLSCNDYKHICPNYKLYHHGHVCEECRGGRFYRAAMNRCCHDSLAYSMASTIEGYVHHRMNIYRKNVHTFLFASEFMASKTEEFWDKGSFRWAMLRNPFDTVQYRMDGPVGDYVLYFGRLIDEKGVDVLLEAAALVRDLPLVVIGDGPDRQALEAQATRLGLDHVRFVGAQWGDDLNRWLRDCRFVVVPSVWHENFPYVIFQAFAAGKPVVGSNRGGIPELIEHGVRGLIYEATAPRELATAMRELGTAREDKVRALGERARHFVAQEFNDERFYTRLIEIYNGVLS